MAAWFPYDVHMLLITLLVIVWYYFKNVYRRFNESNIPFVEPWVPLGNITKSTLRFRHIVDDLHDAYKRFPDHKYFGFFQVNTSIIVLRDPEIIKQITVKDFEYFVNHQPFVNEDLDVLFGRNLFSLKGNKWRDMRSTLSPAFTGSKMKNMCNFMADVGRQVNQYLMAEIHKNNAGNEQSITLELKDLCTRYASDVIATTAFGVKVDSLHDKNNEFYVMGKKSSNFDGIVLLKFFLFAICPKIAAFFNVRLFSEEYCNFYRNLVQGTMEVREKEKIYRPDMIHLLMEAKKGTLKHEEQANEGKAGFATVEESSENIGITKRKWEDDDLTAQAVLFFLAGFETVANFMCFVLYELAVDTEIQKRLHDEIDTSIEENGDDLSYDIMQKLNYLDMIVSETLRKWPPSVVTDRVCSKDYNLAPSKEGSNDGIKLKRNDSLSLPIYSIHRDPTYWPNPDKFDPERFSEENKGNIQPYTFLPFGSGPRNCIGSRYALMEAKIMVYSLLSKFNIKLDEKRTPVPLELDLSSFNLKAKNGFWMTFLPRN